MKRAMVIAAHPDDEVLGCGGLISKYRARGVEFMVLFVGEGSTCRYGDVSDPAALAAIKTRSNSALRALESLGVKEFEFHDLPCGRLDQVPILEINKSIEKSIRQFKPDTVYTHSAHDVNNDHKIVYQSTLMSTRPGAQNLVNQLFCYEVLSSSEWAFAEGFRPNFFEVIDQMNLDEKWMALSCYETEVKGYPFPRSKEGLQALAMMRGMQAGARYAEAFQLVRGISS